MEIKIRAFGQLAEIAGKSEWEMSNVESTEELKLTLAEQFPEFSSLKYSVGVNHKVVQEDTRLHDTDQVALLPPFSGG
jgi:molybdopterin converting factor small subunit